MKQIFLAPRANETSLENFKSSVLVGRPYSFYEPYLTEEEKKNLPKHGNLKTWGTKESLKSRWAKMMPGDYVLFYKEGFFYFSAKVLHTTFSSSLGEAIWGKDKEDGSVWSCIFFIEDLRPIKLPISVVQELADYEPTWDRVQGFMPLNESGIRAIQIKFGTIENFINNDQKVFDLVGNIIEENKEETIDIGEKEISIDKDELLKIANTFKTSSDPFKVVESPHRVRIENKVQKKIIAKLEDYKCQLCGWKLEWTNKKGDKLFRIDIDHIIEKKDGGGEEASNLWALCPNCHTKKTLNVIKLDVKGKKIFENGKEIKMISDNHLGW